MPEETFDLFCPSCNILVAAKAVASGLGRFRSDAVSPDDEVDATYHSDRYVVSVCGRCGGPFLLRQTILGVPAEFETITEETVLYPVARSRALDGVPASAARAFDQALRAFGTGAYDAAAVMCRRALESVCEAKGVQARNLKARIDALCTAGHIDARLQRWAHGVRLLGNEAAHDLEREVSSADAGDILDLVEAILLYVFTLDAKFRAFETRMQQRSQE